MGGGVQQHNVRMNFYVVKWERNIQLVKPARKTALKELQSSPTAPMTGAQICLIIWQQKQTWIWKTSYGDRAFFQLNWNDSWLRLDASARKELSRRSRMD